MLVGGIEDLLDRRPATAVTDLVIDIVLFSITGFGLGELAGRNFVDPYICFRPPGESF